jgi:signal transduction histidine kinase
MVSVFFLYFEYLFGRDRMLQALAKVGGPLDLAYLLRRENFVSLEFCVRLARVLTEESSDPQFLRNAGLYQLSSPRMFGYVYYLVRSLGSPQLYYRMAAKSVSTYNRVCEMTIETLTDRHLRLRYRSLKPEGTRLMCEGRMGQLAAAPTIWGLPPASAREVQCQSSGAPACIYELDWMPQPRPVWRAVAGGAVGAALGGVLWGAPGAALCAALGALTVLAAWYRADARAKVRHLVDAAEATRISMEALRERFEEIQRLHAETEASHRSLSEEMRRRKHAEAALVEAQKLEAVGRLSGGIAHDFNNLLTVILSNAAFAKLRARSPDDVAACMDAISEAGGRAADLTRRLLTFARRQIVEPRVLTVDHHLRQIEKMLVSLLGEDVRLSFDFAPEDLRVLIDPSQFEQVMMNLAVNARDAMPGGGTLRFETRAVTVAAGDPLLSDGLPIGPYVVLRITDSGCGMDEATRQRAFEPFFTTKEPGKGTGLGLATCHGVVSQAQGAIVAHSAVGEGTTFSIYLPRVWDLPREVPAAAVARTGGGTETVLVVEDDAQVRQVVVRTLTAAGYRVIEAMSGQQALALTGSETVDIHLLVSDIVMGGLDGRALADRVRHARAQMRVLYISGYSNEVISKRGVLEEGIQFLRKPFTGDELLGRVRAVLDAPAR